MSFEFSLLFVEDNDDLLEDYTIWFARRGYDVTGVHHPRQALEAVNRQKYGVAVLDYSLPEVSGIELMQQLRHSADIEVIIVSGQDSAQQAAMERGAFAYLLKPCRLAHLGNTIEMAIERHASRLKADVETSTGELTRWRSPR